MVLEQVPSRASLQLEERSMDAEMRMLKGKKVVDKDVMHEEYVKSLKSKIDQLKNDENFDSYI